MQDNNLDGSRKGSTGYRVYKNTSMYSKNASQMEQITLCYFLPAHSWCKRVQTPLHQHATPLSHQSNNANLRWLVINEQNIRREKQVSLGTKSIFYRVCLLFFKLLKLLVIYLQFSIRFLPNRNYLLAMLDGEAEMGKT